MTTMIKEKLDRHLERCIRFATTNHKKTVLRGICARNDFGGYLRAFEELGFITPEEVAEYSQELEMRLCFGGKE